MSKFERFIDLDGLVKASNIIVLRVSLCNVKDSLLPKPLI